MPIIQSVINLFLILPLSTNTIAQGYSLEFSLNKQDDNTIEIMKILPTLKYRYKNMKTGLEFVDQDFLRVEIRKRPLGTSDPMIPSGYYIVPN